MNPLTFTLLIVGIATGVIIWDVSNKIGTPSTVQTEYKLISLELPIASIDSTEVK